eukprot:923344-Pleurochrysis_carterae.AAC.1
MKVSTGHVKTLRACHWQSQQPDLGEKHRVVTGKDRQHTKKQQEMQQQLPSHGYCHHQRHGT